MAGHNAVQVVEVIVVVARGAQHLEWHVAYDGRRSMVEKEKLPFHAVLRGELVAGGIDDAHLAYQLRRLYAARAHKDQLLVHLDAQILLQDARQRLLIAVALAVRAGVGIGAGIVAYGKDLSLSNSARAARLDYLRK